MSYAMEGERCRDIELPAHPARPSAQDIPVQSLIIGT